MWRDFNLAILLMFTKISPYTVTMLNYSNRAYTTSHTGRRCHHLDCVHFTLYQPTEVYPEGSSGASLVIPKSVSNIMETQCQNSQPLCSLRMKLQTLSFVTCGGCMQFI